MPQKELEKRQSLSQGGRERKEVGRDAAETANVHMGGKPGSAGAHPYIPRIQKYMATELFRSIYG